MTDYVQMYAEATGRPDWAEALGMLPEYMRDGVVRYIVHGIQGGSFLNAVFQGDLFHALRCADDTNQFALPAYGRFLMNYAPMGCYGSPDHVRDWIEVGGLNGLSAKEPAA